jgi:hypothetical protein
MIRLAGMLALCATAAKLTFAGLAADPARLQPILDAGDAAFMTYYRLNPIFHCARRLTCPLT